MWRPFTLLKNVIKPTLQENGAVLRALYSTRSRVPRSTAKLTLVSASVGVLIGAGYGGYTHYKINSKKVVKPVENEEYAFLTNPPDYKPHYRIVNESDTTNLQLVLFQYKTCPFCCKVRAYLDARGVSYDVVEVDAVLRQAIKWSQYKKVPILLAKVDGGYQQLQDSTAIISVLETHIREKSKELKELIKYYPVTRHKTEDGKETVDISNKYFLMHNSPINNEAIRLAEMEERQWRLWADQVLVHMISPNVYRTPSEAIDTFKWYEVAGGWRDCFPGWECTLMVYAGAAIMYLIARRLKKKHKLNEDVRQSLYETGNVWTDVIKKKGTKFLGGDEPNLADVTVYGVLSSMEGCEAFADLRQNTDIGIWYDNMKNTVDRRKGKTIVIKS